MSAHERKNPEKPVPAEKIKPIHEHSILHSIETQLAVISERISNLHSDIRALNALQSS